VTIKTATLTLQVAFAEQAYSEHPAQTGYRIQNQDRVRKIGT
jgi:hypothetical protein